jgi:hypothetical protein
MSTSRTAAHEGSHGMEQPRSKRAQPVRVGSGVSRTFETINLTHNQAAFCEGYSSILLVLHQPNSF